MGLEDLGFSTSVATCLVWALRALLPVALFLIWYATQPPPERYDRTQLLALRQAPGKAPPAELRSLHLQEVHVEPQTAARPPRKPRGGPVVPKEATTDGAAKVTCEAPNAEMDLQPKQSVVQEPPAAEPRHLEDLLSFVAFDKERSQRVFLPSESLPPPPPSRHSTERRKASRAGTKENAVVQAILQGLKEVKAGLNHARVAEELLLMLRVAGVAVEQETFVAMIRFCVDSNHPAAAAQLIAEMEADGHEPQEQLGEQAKRPT